MKKHTNYDYDYTEWSVSLKHDGKEYFMSLPEDDNPQDYVDDVRITNDITIPQESKDAINNLKGSEHVTIEKGYASVKSLYSEMHDEALAPEKTNYRGLFVVGAMVAVIIIGIIMIHIPGKKTG